MFIHYCVLQRLQLSIYRASSGIQALMTNNSRKLAKKDESVLMASGIPYTIIRAGMLQNTPGATQGFNFEEVVSLVFEWTEHATLWYPVSLLLAVNSKLEQDIQQ